VDAYIVFEMPDGTYHVNIFGILNHISIPNSEVTWIIQHGQVSVPTSTPHDGIAKVYVMASILGMYTKTLTDEVRLM